MEDWTLGAGPGSQEHTQPQGRDPGGNKRLDAAYRSLNGKGPLYLLFSVNGSGHFCGVAEMKSVVDYNAYAGVWSQDKWKGKFEVKWIFVKEAEKHLGGLPWWSSG